MKDSAIYEKMAKTYKSIDKILSKQLSVTGGDINFSSFLLISIGIFIFGIIIIKANSMENFTYQLEDGRVGERLTGKIKNIKGTHLEKKCYGKKNINHGKKLTNNVEGFSVNDERRIMGENLTGEIRFKNKLKKDMCCCNDGSCKRSKKCMSGGHMMPCTKCEKNCKKI